MNKPNFWGFVFGALILSVFFKQVESMQDISPYEKEQMITRFADIFIGTGIDLARVTDEDLASKISQYVWRDKYILLLRPVNNDLYCIPIDELEAVIKQKIKAAKKIYGIEHPKMRPGL